MDAVEAAERSFSQTFGDMLVGGWVEISASPMKLTPAATSFSSDFFPTPFILATLSVARVTLSGLLFATQGADVPGKFFTRKISSLANLFQSFVLTILLFACSNRGSR